METTKFGMLFVGFLGIIVALAILPQIATNSQELTGLNPVTDDVTTVVRTAAGLINTTATVSTDAAYPSTDWRYTAGECAFTGVVVKNVNKTALTVTDDYVFTAQTGTLTFKNTAAVQMLNQSNTTYISYNYCLPGYLKDSGSRGIGNLIVLLTAVGLLGFGAWIVYKGFKYE